MTYSLNDIYEKIAVADNCPLCGEKKSVEISLQGELIYVCHKCYQRCSVCGEYKRRGDPEYTRRTNCLSCYNLPMEEFKPLSDKTKAYFATSEYKKLATLLIRAKEFFRASMPVEEMIEALRKLPEGSRICVTQAGYYAEGEFGSIYPPEKIKEVASLFVIGDSYQNY